MSRDASRLTQDDERRPAEPADDSQDDSRWKKRRAARAKEAMQGPGNRMKKEGEGCSVDDDERDDRGGKSERRGEPQQGKSLGYHRL